MDEKKPVAGPKRGFVANCARLNIRKEPSMDAAIVAAIDAKTRLTYEPTESEEWYKICTVAGIRGFCRSEFVEG